MRNYLLEQHSYWVNSFPRTAANRKPCKQNQSSSGLVYPPRDKQLGRCPDFSEHRTRTSKYLSSAWVISRLHWGPKLLKLVIPKPGFPVVVPLPTSANWSQPISRGVWCGSLL